MTLIEKLQSDFPDSYDEVFSKEGITECPFIFKYESPEAKPCKKLTPSQMSCSACWDREYISTNTNGNSILDSGELTTFETGAVRSDKNADGSRKGRCDLLPLESVSKCLRANPADYGDVGSPLDCIRRFQNSDDTTHLVLAVHAFTGYPNVISAILDVAIHYEEGAEKYGEDNWRKGLPINNYISSMVRHYLKWLRGDTDEHHDRAFVWNVLCCIWEHDYSPRAVDPEPVRILNRVEPKTKEPTGSVLYICDRTACEACTYPVCKHTKDVRHAVNFEHCYYGASLHEPRYVEQKEPPCFIHEHPCGLFEAMGEMYIKDDGTPATVFDLTRGHETQLDSGLIVRRTRIANVYPSKFERQLREAPFGALFYLNEETWLCTSTTSGDCIYSVRLRDGHGEYLSGDKAVYPVDDIMYE